MGVCACQYICCLTHVVPGLVIPSHPITHIPRAHHDQVSKGYPSAREALVVNGKFLLRQLAALDGKNGKGKGKAAASLSDGAFAKALATEVRMSNSGLLVAVCAAAAPRAQWNMLAMPRMWITCGVLQHAVLHTPPSFPSYSTFALG